MPRVVRATAGAREPGAAGKLPTARARPFRSVASSRLTRLVALMRPLPLLLLLAWLVQRVGGVPSAAAAEADPARALVDALAAQGLQTTPGDVHWLERPESAIASRLERPRAVVRAHRAGAPSDIFEVTTRRAPGGHLLEVTRIYNLTGTSAVDEHQLVVSGPRVAWVLGGPDRTYSVHLADLRGQDMPSGDDWTRIAQWQERLTNLQNTGSLRGVLRRHFRLDPAARHVKLSFSKDALLVDADSRHIRIPTDGHGTIEGRLYVREQRIPLARPGNLVTWAVDRVRALPWFGSDRMQYVKAIAFDMLDWLQRLQGKVTGDDGSARLARQMGDLLDTPATTYTDPETGWPPPPMKPMLSPALPDEGKWRPLDHDPFIRTNPRAPAPFVTSFIRTDHERRYTEIFVTMWDPRQVALHEMSGTVEPKSATGETGPGEVPRKPEVMGRLLGGFNGGFQATHGEYGMMADGVLYLPPKPYAATVAEFKDGSTAFGTWPDDDTVPDNVLSFRQNMTPLVEDGTINPYHRNWWGGVPPGWTDKSRTVRSGVCLTKQGFVGYFYGSSLDAQHLALAMQRAHCVYGIHLDMNPGHTGLEFYKAGPASEIKPLERRLDPQWEAEGDVPRMKGWRFRGRRMLRFMGLMNFPRYIHREARDFFYLTLRHVLPGPPVRSAVPPAAKGEGVWKLSGLPQHGWPYAIATTWVRPDATRPETKVRLLELDPHALRAANGSADAAGQTVVVFHPERETQHGGPSVWLDGERFLVAPTAPSASATRIAEGLPGGARAAAALGIDRGGMLIYAEVETAPDPAADGALLRRLLTARGARRVVLLEHPLGAAIGGERDLSGQPVAPSPQQVRLVRGKAPGARRLFPHTPIVPPATWYPLQAKRIRYFHKPKPKPEAGDSSAGGGPAGSAAGSSGDAPPAAASGSASP